MGRTVLHDYYILVRMDLSIEYKFISQWVNQFLRFPRKSYSSYSNFNWHEVGDATCGFGFAHSLQLFSSHSHDNCVFLFAGCLRCSQEPSSFSPSSMIETHYLFACSPARLYSTLRSLCHLPVNHVTLNSCALRVPHSSLFSNQS